MELKGLRVTEILGTRYPLIQAPMSWVTDARLVAAVSNAGGLGVFAPGAGHDTQAQTPEEDAERIRAQIRKARSLTEFPVGINILLLGSEEEPLGAFSSAWLNVAIEEGIRHFITVGRASEKVFRAIKRSGGIIIHRLLTPTVDGMREAERLGADLLVATGYDEGGHLPGQSWGTFTIVPAMVDAVEIPVLAAGGINDHRGVLAAFALGAEGVFIGTRFIATEECPAAQAAKELIVSSGYKNMVFASPMQRSVRTRTADRLAEMLSDPENIVDLDAEINRFGGLLPAMRQGKTDEGIISVNTGIDVIREILPVEQLVRQLIEPCQLIR